MKRDPIVKQIKESNDSGYLNQLLEFLDMDISSLGKDAEFVQKQKEAMYNKPYNKIVEDQRRYFEDLKEKIKTRLKELNKH